MTNEKLENIKNLLLNYILETDRLEAVSCVDKYVIDHSISYLNAIKDIVLPVINDLTTDKIVTLAQGYFAAKITDDILAKTEANLALNNRDQRIFSGTCVIGNIEDDFHALGRKILISFLKANKWNVIDLGTDVTADTFVDAAVKYNAHIIGVSAMMYTTAVNILKVREEIDRRNLSSRIKLAVGGAVFNLKSNLINEVGGDGTCSNAYEAHKLFSKLHQESTKRIALKE